MKKELTKVQFMAIMNVAKSCEPLIKACKTLDNDIMELEKKRKEKQFQIDALEEGIVNITGLHVNEIVKLVTVPKMKSDGKIHQTTEYKLTSLVTYNEKTGKYTIDINK